MVSTVGSWSRVAGLSKRCRKIERRIYAIYFQARVRLIECSTRLEWSDRNESGEMEVMVEGEDEDKGEYKVLEGEVLTVFASVEAQRYVLLPGVRDECLSFRVEDMTYPHVSNASSMTCKVSLTRSAKASSVEAKA